MIFIETGITKNTDDIHALTKAFFPGEDVRITECDHGVEDASHPVIKHVNSGYRGKLVYKSDMGAMFETRVEAADRDEMKRSVYEALSLYTGRELPWGSLTGIRPTRLVRKRIESGMSENEIIADMKKCYFTSEKKTELSIEIAKKELILMKPVISGNSYSIYADIPFCPTRCLYCSFTSNAVGSDRSLVEAYLDALEKEICAMADMMKGRRIDTVYMGGGTPTALLPEELGRLLKVMRDKFDTARIPEFTVEAGRPDSITPEKLEVLREYGVTRISVNPQTMNQKTLDIIGRRHTVEQVKEAFYMSRKAGFDNINMDIILGLPGETVADVEKTVGELCKLDPDSLTVHSLAIKHGSVMKERLDAAKAEEGTAPEEKAGVDANKAMETADRRARSLGMSPYYLYRQKNMSGNLENTGYAKEGKYGLYNILINEEVQDILAMGAGAISKKVDSKGNTERSANYKEVRDYIRGVDDMIERKRKLFEIRP
ncbi:MAG: coproporphyrinogen dehydrogenase HemZ [Lachnospiraceae bacterium]|nr:coproporphyrinogen dehydrogenase HemZ [Lachnospiraceae bacterium]